MTTSLAPRCHRCSGDVEILGAERQTRRGLIRQRVRCLACGTEQACCWRAHDTASMPTDLSLMAECLRGVLASPDLSPDDRMACNVALARIERRLAGQERATRP